MNPDIAQVVETAWARFRNGPGGELLRLSLSLRSSYLAALGLPRLPPEVTLPGAIPWNLLAQREAEARGEGDGDTLSREGMLLAQSVACWAAYREAKTLYRVEPVLAETLARTPWPDQVPTQALRLPSRCPVLSLPWRGETATIGAYYDLLTGQEHLGGLELRLVLLEELNWWPVTILHLVGDDLAACLRDANRSIQERIEAGQITSACPIGAEELHAVTHSDLACLALTVLLYLAGESDLVRQVHPRAKPAREARMHRRDPERWKNLRGPAVFAVGTAYRAAVERWEIEQRGQPSVPGGRTVRPHVRRAHAHLYWTGPGRTAPRVRFLLPIPVRGGLIPEEAAQPTETPIR